MWIVARIIAGALLGLLLLTVENSPDSLRANICDWEIISACPERLGSDEVILVVKIILWALVVCLVLSFIIPGVYRDYCRNLDFIKTSSGGKQKQGASTFFDFKTILGDCLMVGKLLLSVNRYQLKDIDIGRANAFWQARTCQLLQDGVGSGEALVFMSTEGITVLSGKKDPIDVAVEFRSTRIVQLMSRLTPDMILPGFDPKKWGRVFLGKEFFDGAR